MAALKILKFELMEKFAITPRSLASIEVKDLVDAVLSSERGIKAIVNFPLPVPRWEDGGDEVSWVFRSWAWERDRYLCFLVEFADMALGGLEPALAPFNSWSEVVGRLFSAADGKVYYAHSQLIICRSEASNGNLFSITETKAHKEAAKHLVNYSLAGVVKDLSFALHVYEAALQNGGNEGCIVR